MLSLFDDIERDYQGPADYCEPAFLYINRTGRDSYLNFRKVLEDWFQDYQKDHMDEAEDLRRRFRNRDNEIHYSALTELYTHNLLKNNGFTTEAHPELENSSKRPDFLALKDGVPKFYIEAKALFDKPLRSRIDGFQASILDIVNKVSSPDFLISVDFKKSDDKTPPPISKIKKFIQEKITNLDYEEANRSEEEKRKFPKYTWEYKDWKIGFRFSPVKEEARERRRTEPPRSVGIISHPVRQITLDTSIKNALLSKAKKYGKFSLPFVIILNVMGEQFFCDDYAVMSALFGQEVLRFDIASNGEPQPSHGRNLDGVFVNPKKGITYTRLSGALIIPGLSSHNADTVKPTMWLHPKAEHPFEPGSIKNIRYKIHNPSNDQMEDVEL